MKSKVVFIDMDGTIVSFSDNNDKVIVDDFYTGFFLNRKPVYQVMSKIKEVFWNYDLHILTACPHMMAMYEKGEWLDKHFNIDQIKRHYVLWKEDNKAEFIAKYCLWNDIKTTDCIVIDDDHKVLKECELIGCQVYHPSRILTLFEDELK